MRFSILIPSYNEYENLKILIPEILDSLKNVNYEHELIIIDRVDENKNTMSLCHELDVTYVNRIGGDRYGDAVRTGINYAKSEVIIFMDADGSHDPVEILKLMEMIQKCDIAVSSRYIPEANSQNSYIKELGSLFLNWLCRVLFQIKCTDISNSFKAYKSSNLKKLNLVSNDIDIIQEIIYKLVKSNKHITIHETPGNFRKRINYESRREPLVYFFSYVKTLFNLKFKH